MKMITLDQTLTAVVLFLLLLATADVGAEVQDVRTVGWTRVVNAAKAPLMVTIQHDITQPNPSVRFTVPLRVLAGQQTSQTVTVEVPYGSRMVVQTLAVEGVASNGTQQMILRVRMDAGAEITGDVNYPVLNTVLPYLSQGRFGHHDVLRGAVGRYLSIDLIRDGDINTTPSANVTVIGVLERGE